MSTNRTHRTRLARALAAVGDISYQAALAQVVRAADAGLLPDPLDAAGMRHALDVLLAGTGRATAANPAAAAALALEPRYHRLAQVCGDRLQPGIADRIARAATLGVPAVRTRGSYDPVEILGAVMADPDDPDAPTDWWQRVVAAGTRPTAPCPIRIRRAVTQTGTSRSTAPSTGATPPATSTPTNARCAPSSAANPATSTPTPTSATSTWTWPTPPARRSW